MEKRINSLIEKKQSLIKKYGVKCSIGYMVLNEGIARAIASIDNQLAMLQSA